jgi:hypothetical protein
LFCFALIFNFVFTIGNRSVFAIGSYAPPNPIQPGGYPPGEITSQCSGGVCWPPPNGDMSQSNGNGGTNSNVAGYYYGSNGNLYPIQVGGGGGNTGGFGGGCVGAACINQPTIIWVLITNTPTPTPTPPAVLGPWVKLKDASFNAIDRIQSYIPAAPVAYDADDTTQPYFIIGDGGVVTATSIAFLGLNAGAKADAHDWQDSPYSSVPKMSASDYVSYVMGRKAYKSITSLDEINADGLYLYNTPNNLDITSIPSGMDQHNVVIVSTDNVNIKNTDDYFKPSKSVAIVAPVISFASNIKEAKGIFITMIADTGTTADEGLT